MGKVAEQPVSSLTNLYIGQNGCGQWIVTDGVGHRGGIFIHRNEALRFAAAHQTVAAIFMVPGIIDLLFGAGADQVVTQKQPGVCDRVNGSANAGRYDVGQPAEFAYECRSSDADPDRR